MGSLDTLARATGRVLTVILFGACPLLVVALIFLWKGFAFDFQAFWHAGRDVLEGRSPYAAHVDRATFERALEAIWSRENLFGFVYPAPAAFAMVPLALLPYPVASAVFGVLGLAAILATLALLGVRDWRCYGAALLWVGTVDAIGIGSLTPFLVLGTALVWRYRDRARAAGPVLAALIILKLFLWPLLFWLLATRRRGAAAVAVVTGACVTLAAWWAIDFAGFREYPALVGTLTDVMQGEGFSPVALGLALGLPPGVARAGALLLGGALLAATAVLARRGRDRDAFVLAVGAALALTPIVWNHYFALLLVPVALARPRLAGLWLAPIAIWLTSGWAGGELWRIELGLGVAAVVIAASALRQGERSVTVGLSTDLSVSPSPSWTSARTK